MLKVLYHDHCLDGFGSALVVWLSDRTAQFYPVSYGDLSIGGRTGEDVFYDFFQPDDDLLIVDFSYPRSVLEKIKGRVKSIKVLDHHKTAAAELEGLDYCTFDMEKSGCRLTWEYLNPGMDIPDLLELIEDRDLWRFRNPATKAAMAGLMVLLRQFGNWASFLYDTSMLEVKGDAILQYQAMEIDTVLENVRMVNWNGHGEIPVVNCTGLWSEVGEAMNLKYPDSGFSATYYQMVNGKWKWGLRSNGPNSVDVSAIAKRYGGGGHAKAAGFVKSELMWL